MPIKVKIYDKKGEEAGEMELAAKVFGLKPSLPLIHQAMVAQAANERQNIAHTKDRSEVRGGGKKPWKQKGTGRARAGSSRSPIWIGGGVTFGPRNERNFSKKINVKMRRKALCMVLSDKISSNSMFVLQSLDADSFKTKAMDALISSLEKKLFKQEKTKQGRVKKGRSILLLNDSNDEKVYFSLRNLRGVKTINLQNINILDVLKHRNMIVAQGAVKALENIYNKTK